jgi:hypothetical protein
MGSIPGRNKVRLRCAGSHILIDPALLAKVLTLGHKAPNLERFSQREDRIPAARIDIIRGDVLQRISAAPVQYFTALRRLGRMVRMRGTGRARNQARGGLGAFVVP